MGHWLDQTNLSELAALIVAWNQLSPRDRMVLGRIEVFGPTAESAEIAKDLEITDIEDHEVGICGCEGTVKYQSSPTVQLMRGEIKGKITTLLIQAGVFPNEEQESRPWVNGRKLSHLFFALGELVMQGLGEPPLDDRKASRAWYKEQERRLLALLLPERHVFQVVEVQR